MKNKTELKTLKDIKIKGSNGRIRLKAEAMKWVRALQLDIKNKLYNGRSDRDAICNFIFHFFNLTNEEVEEYLKDE